MNRRSYFPSSETWWVELWSKAHFKFQVAKPRERAFEENADTPSALTTLSHTTVSVLPGPHLQVVLSPQVVSGPEHTHTPQRNPQIDSPVLLPCLVGKQE